MILVTGGAGFIGSNYLYYLCRQYANEPIVCVDSLTYASNYTYIQPLIESGRVKFELQDITDADAVKQIFKKYQPDYVVHFAAESHVDNSIRDLTPFVQTNILGTVNLLQAATQLSDLKKFVHVSTDEVYGSLADTDPSFTEQDPYETNSPYSASKAASDCFARAFYSTYRVPIVVTNCSNNYGPNQHQEKFIPTIIRQAELNQPIPVYGQGVNVRDWLYVEDHCRALDMVVNHGRIGERYNIGGGEELTNTELVKKILAIMGRSADLIEYVEDRLGHDLRYSIDCSKIEQELGYEPAYDLETGLEKTIEWYTR